MKFTWLYFFTCLLYTCVYSQRTDTVGHKLYVRDIHIQGIKKTKEYVIFREMTIKKGDSIAPELLESYIRNSRHLIYNTNLFSIVKISSTKDTFHNLEIIVDVIERWYIYPTPQFKLIDRNFNEWWKTYGADLDRVSYGIKFAHYNISGRADQLNIVMLNGYSRNYGIGYLSPYSNRSLTAGFSIGFNFSQSREFSYKTSSENKLMWYHSPNFDRSSVMLSASYRIRKGYYKTHIFYTNIQQIKVLDSVLTAHFNPNYLGTAKTSVRFVDLAYEYQYTNVNNVNYPLRGNMFKLNFYKRGFGLQGGLNMFSVDLAYKKFIVHPHHFYSSFQAYSKIKIPFDQPYINQRAMGYGKYYLRGLEYYVIDGVASGFAQYTFSKKICALKVPMPFKNKWIPYIPFNFLAKTYADMGYVYSKEKPVTLLNNRLLYTGGIGLDILTLYDLRLSVEYSFNQLAEKGLFLHTQSVL